MSRTRLLRPAYFGDEEIAVGLSRDSRLAYAGLWTECDDAGYFEARPRQLARALFGYDSDGLEVVEEALRQLVALGKVELLECGVHGVVPSLPDHAQQGGNKAFNHRAAHERCGQSEQVRTRSGQVPPTPRAASVRTRPDKSRSESVSESDSDEGARRKKNVLEETVAESTGRTQRATPPPAPFLSDLPDEGRPDASEAVSPSRIAVPPRLAAITPRWLHVCTDYTKHQSFHRIVDGVAQCDKCEEALALAGNGAAPDPAASIWGPVQ